MTPLVWAHRGAGGWDTQYAPENTMPAFERAIAMGADGLELDVQLTRDGEVVVCHDETIDRTSDGKGWLHSYTLQELRKFNFAKPHPEFGVVRIPTLQEVLEYMAPMHFFLNIELKTGRLYYDRLEEKTLELVEKMNLGPRVIYSSFNHASLARMRQLSAKARLGLLCNQLAAPMLSPMYLEALKPEAVHPEYNNVDEIMVAAIHAAGLKVHVWTVDAPVKMERLLALGVEAFITDCPDTGRSVVDAWEAEQ